MTKWKHLLISCFTLFTLAAPAHAEVPGATGEMPSATQGIVTVSHPAAAEVGKQILAKGGNAVDAAAAIQFALNVVEPHMSGIGGGGFLMLYLKDQDRIISLDSREMAPRDSDPRQFLDANGEEIEWFERHTKGNAVGVPGTLLGVDTALKRYGTMKLADVIDPAIQLAERGVKVNWTTADHIANNVEKLVQYETAGRVFVPNGQPLKEGDLLVQPDLAKTLRLIKEKGPDVFYKGEIGQALVQEVQKRGGKMTMRDLAEYAVKDREPVRGTFRGYEIVSMGPPSSGGLTVLQILKLMEGFDNEKAGVNSAEYLHNLIEANHLAYADRAAYMGDEDYVNIPKKGLLDDRYIKERRALINPERANANVAPGDPWKYEANRPSPTAFVDSQNERGQTTHFSIVDKWGNMVAYTTTIEDYFGSGIMVPGYGFMLNNELTDFDAQPGGPNQLEPGKRPRSSMTPTILLKDKKPFMAVGSPGGSTIIASVSQTILNVIDHKMPIQDAILTPGMFSSNYPDVEWEPGISQDVILQLMAKGHVFYPEPWDIGNVQAVVFDLETGNMYGGADNTREGTVLGVDGVSFTAAPFTYEPPQDPGAFVVKINGAILPFTAEQKLLQKGTAWIQADKLLLGLGGDSVSFAADQRMIDGVSYLPVAKVAKALGYQVSWNGTEKAVLLEK